VAGERLFVVLGAPAGFLAVVGEARLVRLAQAHPRVTVEVTHDEARFAELLPTADAAFVFGGFERLLGLALRPGGCLRWVHSLPVGVDHLLTPEVIAAEHVALTSSKGPMGPLMAEHIVLLMLALARDLPGFLRDQAEKRWRFLADERPMVDLLGKTIVILGIGNVGSNLARICKLAFGMRVLGMARTRRDDPHVDRYFDRAELHAALAEADFVALALALTPETDRIVDAAALAAMKPSAFLVNVSRGVQVDEDALIEALRSGSIAGAGLDSVADEPLSPDSPLWEMPNVIITPHVSPGRDRFGERMVDFWCENVRRFAEGEPLLGAVDRNAGY
jgi:phosphoglycerate dehydrogenase-like enzyme